MNKLNTLLLVVLGIILLLVAQELRKIDGKYTTTKQELCAQHAQLAEELLTTYDQLEIKVDRSEYETNLCP